MHTCMHTYIHTYIQTYRHTDIHTYIHTYTYIHSYTHSYIHTFIHPYIHTFIHSYIYTYIHICIFAYLHIYIFTYTYTYIHIHAHAHTHTFIYIYMDIHTFMHAYMHTCIHTYIHTCIVYAHTHTQTQLHIYMLLKAPQTEMRGNILEFEISNRLQKFCEISHCLQLFSGFQASVHALNNLFTLQERHEFSKDEFAEILTTPHPQTLRCGSPTSPLPFYIPCPVRQFSLFYFENRRFQASLHPFAPRHQHSLLKQLNTGGETDTAEPSAIYTGLAMISIKFVGCYLCAVQHSSLLGFGLSLRSLVPGATSASRSNLSDRHEQCQILNVPDLDK